MGVQANSEPGEKEQESAHPGLLFQLAGCGVEPENQERGRQAHQRVPLRLRAAGDLDGTKPEEKPRDYAQRPVRRPRQTHGSRYDN